MPFFDQTNIFKTIVKEKWAAVSEVERRKSSAPRRDTNQHAQAGIGKEYLTEAYKIVRTMHLDNRDSLKAHGTDPASSHQYTGKDVSQRTEAISQRRGTTNIPPGSEEHRLEQRKRRHSLGLHTVPHE